VLDAVAAVDLHLATVVHPRDAEGDRALGLDQPVEEGVLRIALVGRDEGPQALHDLGHGLQKLGLAGVALFDVGQELLEGTDIS
jgi:hypothetical protein